MSGVGWDFTGIAGCLVRAGLGLQDGIQLGDGVGIADGLDFADGKFEGFAVRSVADVRLGDGGGIDGALEYVTWTSSRMGKLSGPWLVALVVMV